MSLTRWKTDWRRLTHSQTRFLMSEFSRQAHPDAAHRERLSKEIPGLSPRQVQVWFQNRFDSPPSFLPTPFWVQLSEGQASQIKASHES